MLRLNIYYTFSSHPCDNIPAHRKTSFQQPQWSNLPSCWGSLCAWDRGRERERSNLRPLEAALSPSTRWPNYKKHRGSEAAARSLFWRSWEEMRRKNEHDDEVAIARWKSIWYGKISTWSEYPLLRISPPALFDKWSSRSISLSIGIFLR